MSDLLSIPTPRPESIVEDIAGPAARRTRRLVRIMSSVFFSIPLVTVIGMVASGGFQSGPTHQLSQDVATSAVVMFYLGVLPYIAIRRIVGHDARLAPVLVRDGTAHRVMRTRDIALQALWGSLYYVEVWWDDNRRRALVRTEQPLRGIRADAVVVLALPRKKQVGVVLGDHGLWIGAEQRVRQR